MYVIVWQFEVSSENKAAFLTAYGPDGDWARLFALSPGYLGTELLGSAADNLQFITMDRWQSQSAFVHFQVTYTDLYRSLDTQLEKLTIAETRLGAYITSGASIPR